MPTVPLPDQPNLEQLKRQARDLQRAARAGDEGALAHVREHDPRSLSSATSGAAAAATFPLRSAQLVLARHYGFASWARLKAHVELVTRYTRLPDRVEATDDPASEFLRLACLTYGADDPDRWAQARRILAEHPEVAHANVYVAAATADTDRVRALLESDPGAVTRDGGPFGWVPLFYLAYARHDPTIAAEAVLATAARLLEQGADPNAGYLWHGLPTPFTLLTGAFGEGEGGPVRQPRHPHSIALARQLLVAGADPNDGQALYNRMFEPDDDHLRLLFEFGLGTGDGGPWRARLGDAIDTPADLVHQQLAWAVVHGMRARVELLVDNGADITRRFADGHTAIETAVVNGDRDLIALLEARGAAAPTVAPVEALVGAILAADRAAIEALRAADPDIVEVARAVRPSLMVWAAANRRRESIALLAELGFDVNAFGRGDVPVEQRWETALHQAVANDDHAMAVELLALGADPNVRDTRFHATPLGWAAHFDHPALTALLQPLTTEEPTAD